MQSGRLSTVLARLCLVLAVLAIPVSAREPALLAIIIDDLGYNQQRGIRAINLPGAITYSVIQEGDHATTLARYAHQTGKEVMVHLPMENTNNQPLGTMGLTSISQASDIEAVLSDAVQRVPHATGLNNHMGSSLTRQPQVMAWLMRAIKKHGYYFVDSRTTDRKSVV